jgi:hypothetical protein
MRGFFRRIKRFFKALFRETKKVAPVVTGGRVIVNDKDEILLDEESTTVLEKRIVSIVLTITAVILLSAPDEFKFLVVIGDRVIRTATMFWSGNI